MHPPLPSAANGSAATQPAGSSAPAASASAAVNGAKLHGNGHPAAPAARDTRREPARDAAPAPSSGGAATAAGAAHDPLRPRPAVPRPPSGVLGAPAGEDLVVFHRRAAGDSRFVLRESFD